MHFTLILNLGDTLQHKAPGLFADYGTDTGKLALPLERLTGGRYRVLRWQHSHRHIIAHADTQPLLIGAWGTQPLPCEHLPDVQCHRLELVIAGCGELLGSQTLIDTLEQMYFADLLRTDPACWTGARAWAEQNPYGAALPLVKHDPATNHTAAQLRNAGWQSGPEPTNCNAQPVTAAADTAQPSASSPRKSAVGRWLTCLFGVK